MISKLKAAILNRSKWLTRKFLSGEGHVLMLHRVLPQKDREKYSFNKGLAISIEGLEEKIKWFQELDFDFISMNQVEFRLRNPLKKKWIAFTLDDGYADNLSYALPVFEKYNIPFTIYVSNCFPNNKAIYWWYDLERYIINNDFVDLSPIKIECRYPNKTPKEKLGNYNRIRELLRKGDVRLHENFIVLILGELLDDYHRRNKSLNLTWKEIIKLNEHPLVTIGAHTLNHVSLKNQTDKDIKTQILVGIEEMESKTGTEMCHFAYPYGSLDDVDLRTINVLKNKKIKTAVLNHPGGIFKEHINSLYQIPRMGLSDETPENRIKDLISGKLHLNFNGIKKVIEL